MNATGVTAGSRQSGACTYVVLRFWLCTFGTGCARQPVSCVLIHICRCYESYDEVLQLSHVVKVYTLSFLKNEQHILQVLQFKKCQNLVKS